MARGRNGARGLDGKAVSADDEANEPVGGIEHNSAARKNILRECAAEFRAIKAKRAALNEEAGEVRQRLKDAGLSVEALQYALKVEERDEDDRAAYLDSVREAFEALSIGEQGALFPDGAKASTDGDGDGDEDDDPRPRHMRTPAEGGTKLQ